MRPTSAMRAASRPFGPPIPVATLLAILLGSEGTSGLWHLFQSAGRTVLLMVEVIELCSNPSSP